MLTFDSRELIRLEHKLKLVADRAVPFATQRTINQMAWAARDDYQEQIRDDFTNRNRWTERSVRAETTRSLIVRQQESRTGSLAPYMALQESGGLKTPSAGAQSVSIATGYSAGQRGQKPRTRLPRAPNKMSRIQLRKRGRTSNRKQANAIAVSTAARTGQKFVYLDLGRREGIFRITGGKRRPKVNMVHEVGRRSVRIPARPMLEPASERAGRRMPEFYRAALLFQLNRIR